ETLGREICKQANVNALVIASIRKLGRLYTIDLKVLDPQKNEYLFTAKEEGEGQERVSSMIDKLAEKTRVGLKEKAAEIQATSQKVAEVTTPNLEAYQHYFKGEELVGKLKWEEAKAEFNQAIALDTTFALAYYRLAYATGWTFEEGAKESIRKAMEYIERVPEKERYLIRAWYASIEGNIDEAIAIHQELLKLYPDEKEALFEIGDLSFHQGNYGTAVSYFEKVLAMDPTFERALQHLSWLYGSKWEFDKSLEYAKRLMAVNEQQGTFAVGAYQYRVKGEFAIAVGYFEKALTMDPADEVNLFYLTTTYVDLRQYDKALEYAKKYVSQSANPFAHSVLASVHLSKGDLTTALETYERGLEAFPDDPGLLSGRGNTYAFMGEYDGAEAELKAMTAEDNSEEVRRRGFTELSFFYSYVGKYSEMMKAKDRLIEFAWRDKHSVRVAVETLWKAREMYQWRKDKEEALREIGKIADFDKITNQRYFYYLASLYYEIGDVDKASKASEKVTISRNKLRLQAREHHGMKDWDKAISLYKRIVAINPSDQSYYRYRAAQCYFEKDDLDKAVEDIKGAQSYYGQAGGHGFVYSRGFYLLGKIYEKKGDQRLAIENYEKFLDLWKDADKDLPELLDAKSRLAKLKGVAVR
ncbi:MAG: tetratricopeptide repeat protein, partial [Bacteroidota bacterium]